MYEHLNGRSDKVWCVCTAGSYR